MFICGMIKGKLIERPRCGVIISFTFVHRDGEKDHRGVVPVSYRTLVPGINLS